MFKKCLALFSPLFLVACVGGSGDSTQNNISLTTTAGNCPTGMTNSPYCMAVTINNNASGQNYINSSNYPISSISVITSGVNNVISPMNNASTMDPNNCTSQTIAPGGSCTFYLGITSEAYNVSARHPISIGINYTINDSLFVNGDHKGSNNLTIYENTNLYVLNTQGQLWTYNAQGLSNMSSAESSNAGTVISSTLDTLQTGKLVLASANNIWAYGLGNVSASIAKNSGLVGANVMFVNTNGLYASSATNGTFYNAIESYGNFVWTNKTTPSVKINPNAYALTPTTGLYVAQGNQALNCSGVLSSTVTSCQNEAVPLASTVNAMAFAGTLYAGTSSNGVYYETGSGANALWSSIDNISSGSINMMKSDLTNSNVIVADNSNNIWQISSGASSANTIIANLATSVNAFAIDNYATAPNIYYVTGSNLFSCGNNGFMNCQPKLLANGLSGTMLNLLIGSSLSAN